jgi:glycosyltransferase involved in cell wall biosynthesis
MMGRHVALRRRLMKHLDVLIVGDFRFPGGTSAAIAHELRALRSTDHSVGLYHVNSAYLSAKPIPWHRDIEAEANRGGFHVLADGTAAQASVMFVHSPWILRQVTPTRLRASVRILVTHHPPADARGQLYYDPRLIERHARRAFGGSLVWAPISPVCRDAFDTAGLAFPRLRMDWTNLIFVDDWGAARSRLSGDHPVIGRHSRPRNEKWPATRDALFEVFPSSGDIQVRLMGVSEKMKRLIGECPVNWQTMDAGAIPVREFLSAIDFFVYFHHPDWVEAYGRTVAEAAAAGCIVILPPYLRKTFGDAGLYCEPAEAIDVVRSVAANRERFAELSARGRELVDQRFGLTSYLNRLEQVLAAARGDVSLAEIIERPRLTLPALLQGEAKRAAFYWQRRRARISKMRPKHALKQQVKRFRRLLD